MPMQINVPVDIADVLQGWLNGMGVAACADPLPRGLSMSLPLTLVQPMGAGTRSDVVVDRFAVRLYTWAADEQAAIAASSMAMACLCAAEEQVTGGTQVYRVTPTSTPYPAYDPDHPNLARACSTAYVWARANTIERSTSTQQSSSTQQ